MLCLRKQKTWPAGPPGIHRFKLMLVSSQFICYYFLCMNLNKHQPFSAFIDFIYFSCILDIFIFISWCVWTMIWSLNVKLFVIVFSRAPEIDPCMCWCIPCRGTSVLSQPSAGSALVLSEEIGQKIVRSKHTSQFKVSCCLRSHFHLCNSLCHSFLAQDPGMMHQQWGVNLIILFC